MAPHCVERAKQAVIYKLVSQSHYFALLRLVNCQTGNHLSAKHKISWFLGTFFLVITYLAVCVQAE